MADEYGEWVAELLGVDTVEEVPEALRGLENGWRDGGRRTGRAAASRAAAKAFRRGALASGRHVHMVGPEGTECLNGPAGCGVPLGDPSQGCTGDEEGIGGHEVLASWTDEVAAWTVGEAEETPTGYTGTPGEPLGGPPAQTIERRGKGAVNPCEPLKELLVFESEGKEMMEGTPMGGDGQDGKGSTGVHGFAGDERGDGDGEVGGAEGEGRSASRGGRVGRGSEDPGRSGLLHQPGVPDAEQDPRRRGGSVGREGQDRGRARILLIGLRELGPSLAIGALACLAAIALIVINILGITGVWGGTGTTPDCATLEKQTGIPASSCVEAPRDPSSDRR